MEKKKLTDLLTPIMEEDDEEENNYKPTFEVNNQNGYQIHQKHDSTNKDGITWNQMFNQSSTTPKKVLKQVISLYVNKENLVELNKIINSENFNSNPSQLINLLIKIGLQHINN